MIRQLKISQSSTNLPWRSALVALVTAATLAIASPAFAKKVGRTTIPDSVPIAGSEVPVRGGGLRTRSVFKLYAAGLYTDMSGDGNFVSQADAPMAIHLRILSKLINKNRMVTALKVGFDKSTGGDTSAIQSSIDQMIAAMDKPITTGTTYTLAYQPDVGTTMTRNGEDAVVIEGLAFKQALFGIWLGDAPVQARLKKGMLGE